MARPTLWVSAPKDNDAAQYRFGERLAVVKPRPSGGRSFYDWQATFGHDAANEPTARACLTISERGLYTFPPFENGRVVLGATISRKPMYLRAFDSQIGSPIWAEPDQQPEAVA